MGGAFWQAYGAKEIKLVAGMAVAVGDFSCSTIRTLLDCMESITYCYEKKHSVELPGFSFHDLEIEIETIQNETEFPREEHILIRRALQRVANGKQIKEAKVPLAELQSGLKEALKRYKSFAVLWTKRKRAVASGMGSRGKPLRPNTVKVYQTEIEEYGNARLEQKVKIASLSSDIKKRLKVNSGALVEKRGVLFRVICGAKGVRKGGDGDAGCSLGKDQGQTQKGQ